MDRCTKCNTPIIGNEVPLGRCFACMVGKPAAPVGVAETSGEAGGWVNVRFDPFASVARTASPVKLMNANTHPEEAIECPACRAAPGRPCKAASGRGNIATSHPARRKAFAEAQEGRIMFTKGQKVGMNRATGYWLPAEDGFVLGVVINQPSVENVARIDVYRGCEKIAGGPRVETSPSHQANAKADIPTPGDAQVPLPRVSAVLIAPLITLVGPIGWLPAGVNATVLRVTAQHAMDTNKRGEPIRGAVKTVTVRVRRWDTDEIRDLVLAPADAPSYDPNA